MNVKCWICGNEIKLNEVMVCDEDGFSHDKCFDMWEWCKKAYCPLDEDELRFHFEENKEFIKW